MVCCNKAVHRDPYPGHVGQLRTGGSLNICQQSGKHLETPVHGNYLNWKRKNNAFSYLFLVFSGGKNSFDWKQLSYEYTEVYGNVTTI